MKISVVMTYYNRRPQTLLTLRSIELSKHQDLEVVIVDDCSAQEHRLDDIVNSYRFPIKLIRIPERGMHGRNPCVIFNIGFSNVSDNSEVIAIQNPENLHYGDILSHIANNIKENRYLLYACRSIQAVDALKLLKLDPKSNDLAEDARRILSHGNPSNPWYTKYERYNKILHFMSAIHRNDLSELNGFDERYRYGNDFDDNEFYERIVKKGVEIIIHNEDVPFVLHQWHEHALHTGMPGARELYLSRYAINKALLEETLKNPNFRVNFDKVIIYRKEQNG